MFKDKGYLRRVKFFKRKFGGNGIILFFSTEKNYEIPRTFNIPKSITSKRSALAKFLEKMKIEIPNYLSESPFLLSAEVERQAKEKSYFLTITESENPEYPLNIDSISIADNQ